MADDAPYSTSSGCATTHSTRRKAPSGNGASSSAAMARGYRSISRWHVGLGGAKGG
jgi:hypothetical protein